MHIKNFSTSNIKELDNFIFSFCEMKEEHKILNIDFH